MESLNQFGFIAAALNSKINALVKTLNHEQMLVYQTQLEKSKKLLYENYCKNQVFDEKIFQSLAEQWF